MNLEEASLWDIVMFGGDMSKMSYLGVSSAKQLYESIDRVLSQLQAGYAEAQEMLGYSPITTRTDCCARRLLGWKGCLYCTRRPC